MITRFNNDTGITEVLVDARNVDFILPDLMERVRTWPHSFVGFDIESHDRDRHAGLNQFMAIDPKKTTYKKPKKLVFDTNRTTVTGFSIYLQNDKADFYFNLAHADIENRIPFSKVLPLLELIKQTKTWVIHNATYEICICKKSLNFDIGSNYICSMQLCVSAYNTDEYDIEKFKESDLRGIAVLIPEIAKTFAGYDGKSALNTQQNDLLQRVIGKQSSSNFSYNGFVKDLAYGYNLKKAVSSWFGYQQETFEECLQGKLDMGALTGEEVLHYGADDAYWCVRLFERVWQFMNDTNPQVVQTFIEQENPMLEIWAETWGRGIRLNYEQLNFRMHEARKKFAHQIRALVPLLRQFKFSLTPSARMLEKQPWYLGKPQKGKEDKFVPKYNTYRARFEALMAADVDDLTDFEVTQLVSGSVSESWAIAEGKKSDKSKGNLSHFQMARVLFHDLLDLPLMYDKGKVSSDGASRGKLKDKIDLLASDPNEWLKEFGRYKQHTHLNDEQRLALATEKMQSYNAEAAHGILNCLDAMASIEQYMKLFITPYLMLVDPETHRVYPTISSLLNTRRMGCQNPNGMQLSKRGESVFVRGFFLPERDDHLLVCVDWSQVELVLIGEDSKDPKFFEAYGQIPYKDLHLGAAASAVRVYHPEFTDQHLNDIGGLTTPEITTFKLTFPKVFIDPISNTEMDASKVKKFWRNKAGKVSNFGYWYSGSLMTVQPNLGWSMDEMWEATENYRKQFPVAEAWRIRTQLEAKMYGFVYIFDGHRRTRYEATNEWYNAMVAKFAVYGNPAVTAFGQKVCKSIQRRSGNQVVNAKIQGGCAPLAKRSIKKLNDQIKAEGWDACFLLPIHDELVFSARYDQALDFAQNIKRVMCNFPEFVSWLKLDGTISIGGTLEPFDAKKAPTGQIELDEAPLIEGVLDKSTYNKALCRADQEKVVNYLMTHEATPTLE